jgi:hypothetical protein
MGGDSIYHWDQKVNMNVCLILNDYRDGAVLFYKYESTVKGNRKINYLLLI